MNRLNTACALVLSVAVQLAVAADPPAAPLGDLPIGSEGFTADAGFAAAGSAIVDYHNADAVWSEPVRTLADAAGGYWVLGFVRPNTGNDQFAITHLLADGTPDAAYGVNGQRIVTIAAVQIQDATMDAAGNFYVAAVTNGDGADYSVECFGNDGTACAGFGLGGQTQVPFDQGGPNDDIARRILIRDGSIYLLGDVDTPSNSGPWNVAVGIAKLDLASGALDASFGNVDGLPGRAVYNIDLVADGDDYSADFAFSPDGRRLIAAGSSVASDATSGISLEYAYVLGIDPASGQLDADFGDAGQRIVPFDVGESIGQFLGKDVIVRQNGRIVVLGDYWHDIDGTVNPEVALIQLTAAGDLDAGFGNAGVATNLPGYTVETLAVAERPGAGDLVVTLEVDGLFPGDSTDHQQAL
ncbi:MAG: hypothetical protein ABW187_04825, partial [Dokdonella sp.]